jgi:hypothetical protein
MERKTLQGAICDGGFDVATKPFNHYDKKGKGGIPDGYLEKGQRFLKAHD